MENALQLLGQFPENREQIKTFVSSFVTSAKNGYNEPLEVLKKLKVLEELTKEIKSELKEFFLTESDKFTENTIEQFGCKFTKQSRPSYDFTICDDSEWLVLSNNLLIAKKELSERENMLKSLTSNIVSEDTGEIIKPPSKTYNSLIAVSLK